MTDIELLPLPNSGSGFYEDNVWHDTFSKRQMEACARANMAPLITEIERLRAEVERLKTMTAVTMGVGCGGGSLFVHGDYDSIKAAQALMFRAERLAEEIDWIKSQPEGDRMFAEIEAAAKASFHRHRTSCRGQVLTRADNYESHLVWATLEWAKRTNGAEQRAERLAEALRRAEGLLRSAGIIAESDLERPHSAATEIKNALRDHGQEGGDG